ncbi:hypothetical protein ACFYW9_37250 [Streptomyces sp. NPDC002698]|uniref:hypothetical protein n=1 Tax=Streptomyces sp. NPDC002698 TaxID=3364660 RepID=UPI0036A72414
MRMDRVSSLRSQPKAWDSAYRTRSRRTPLGRFAVLGEEPGQARPAAVGVGVVGAQHPGGVVRYRPRLGDGAVQITDPAAAPGE